MKRRSILEEMDPNEPMLDEEVFEESEEPKEEDTAGTDSILLPEAFFKDGDLDEFAEGDEVGLTIKGTVQNNDQGLLVTLDQVKLIPPDMGKVPMQEYKKQRGVPVPEDL
jgi:hypothetical protein